MLERLGGLSWFMLEVQVDMKKNPSFSQSIGALLGVIGVIVSALLVYSYQHRLPFRIPTWCVVVVLVFTLVVQGVVHLFNTSEPGESDDRGGDGGAGGPGGGGDEAR